ANAAGGGARAGFGGREGAAVSVQRRRRPVGAGGGVADPLPIPGGPAEPAADCDAAGAAQELGVPAADAGRGAVRRADGQREAGGGVGDRGGGAGPVAALQPGRSSASGGAARDDDATDG